MVTVLSDVPDWKLCKCWSSVERVRFHRIQAPAEFVVYRAKAAKISPVKPPLPLFEESVIYFALFLRSRDSNILIENNGRFAHELAARSGK